MTRLITLIIFFISICCWQSVLAAGTPANTIITTQATAEYNVGAATVALSSNILTATVAEVLDVDVTWQDGSPVTVYPQDTDQVLTLRATNTGNGTETFVLAGSGVVSGDDFDPVVTAIYLDSNGNDIYEAGTDTLYTAGVNDPTLPPDAAITLFALSNIPGNLSDGTSGRCRISATANTGTGSPGDALDGLGDSGTDAVIGSSGGSANVIGTYAISNAHLSVIKSATILDLQGGNLPSTGAVITYEIQIQATGSGTARSVMFSDPIPGNTTYRPHSLHLNGTQLSDAQDSDAGDVGVSAANTVTVDLGDLTDSSPAQTIIFEVAID